MFRKNRSDTAPTKNLALLDQINDIKKAMQEMDDYLSEVRAKMLNTTEDRANIFSQTELSLLQQKSILQIELDTLQKELQSQIPMFRRIPSIKPTFTTSTTMLNRVQEEYYSALRRRHRIENRLAHYVTMLERHAEIDQRLVFNNERIHALEKLHALNHLPTFNLLFNTKHRTKPTPAETTPEESQKTADIIALQDENDIVESLRLPLTGISKEMCVKQIAIQTDLINAVNDEIIAFEKHPGVKQETNTPPATSSTPKLALDEEIRKEQLNREEALLAKQIHEQLETIRHNNRATLTHLSKLEELHKDLRDTKSQLLIRHDKQLTLDIKALEGAIRDLTGTIEHLVKSNMEAGTFIARDKNKMDAIRSQIDKKTPR